MLDSSRYSRDVFASLSTIERTARLVELEASINDSLSEAGSLSVFQSKLYAIIEDRLVNELGHWLCRWEYDCEIEYWGGKSYMDTVIPNELLLRSEYPHGVQLRWGEFNWSM